MHVCVPLFIVFSETLCTAWARVPVEKLTLIGQGVKMQENVWTYCVWFVSVKFEKVTISRWCGESEGGRTLPVKRGTRMSLPKQKHSNQAPSLTNMSFRDCRYLELNLFQLDSHTNHRYIIKRTSLFSARALKDNISRILTTFNWQQYNKPPSLF